MLFGLSCAAPQLAGAYTVYVTGTSGSSVTPIDTVTNLAGPAIKVATAPLRPAVSPDGKTLYVPDSAGLTPVSTATNTAGPPIKLPAAGSAVAISPDGKTAYVAINTGVVPVNLQTATAGTEIETPGASPEAIAITPDGKTLYVANTVGTVTPIPTATGVPGSLIKVGSEPKGIAIAPNGKTAYVANGNANTVTPIDIATNTAGKAIPVAGRPYAIAVAPGGATAYTADDAEGGVTPVNLTSDAAGTAFEYGTCLDAIAVTPDGKTIYVADACKNTVVPINTATGVVGTPIEVAKGPEGLTITPDQPPVAALSASAVTLGQATSFSAAASSDAAGTIASYAWDFGDGVTTTTTTPTVSHTYATAGIHTARVTLTDGIGCSTSFVFGGQTAFCNGSGVASATASALVSAFVSMLPVSLAVTPNIGSLTQSHSRWRAGAARASISRRRRPAVGTTFAFTLNEAAGVTLTFKQSLAGRKVKGRCVAVSAKDRHKPACKRTVVRGSLTFAAHAGAEKISFQGRLSSTRKLAPGSYSVTFLATDAGGRRSSAKTLSFTIVS